MATPAATQSGSQSTQDTTTFTLPNDLTPSSLDTLPLMTSLLVRLQTHLATNSLQPTGSTPLPSSQPQSIDRSPFSTCALSTKDIPLAADELKQRIRKARAAISKLEDMDRTVDEQEVEIRELEEKIRAQREAVVSLRIMGERGAESLAVLDGQKGDDVNMDGS